VLEQGVIVPRLVLSAVRPKRDKIKQVKRQEIHPNFGTVILGSPQVVPTVTKTGLLPKQTDIRGPRGPLDCLPGEAVLLVLATTPVAGAEMVILIPEREELGKAPVVTGMEKILVGRTKEVKLDLEE